MRNMRSKNKLSYYAKILSAMALSFVLYGLFLNFYNSQKVLDPINDFVFEENDGNEVNITTVEEVTPTPDTPISNSGDSTNNSGSSSSEGNGNSTNPSPNPTTNNASNSNNISDNNQNHVIPQGPTIDEINNNLRNEIQDTFNVTVRYGSETEGYSAGGIMAYPITDSNVVNNQLNQLKATLSLYPYGMFTEIKNGGIPLTIILINNYSEDAVTGITDSNYNYANISIAAKYPFGESFYHESYHYIERYLFKRGANYASWDSLNPAGFSWNVVDGGLSYSNTFSEYASFVNNYAQTAAEEDRASTFEYMMAGSKARCLNYGTTIWQKASLMANTMDLVLDSVSPDVVEYWERFL